MCCEIMAAPFAAPDPLAHLARPSHDEKIRDASKPRHRGTANSRDGWADGMIIPWPRWNHKSEKGAARDMLMTSERSAAGQELRK